ncbi:hypothetical protein [Tepidiforma sp.]|uniref:DUF7452 domain-containing protein n=1 Tax=Tepidiforma sp. TaxID=2682230 RepID=UPI0021DBF9A7|nr:hypothetical protein [Tepidiforma sp.]MCX7616720.1 hypothetical protein [Tepidiforma sp.]GIW19553.1 MAG: hypothetical protein KatS3mg064_2710 [Tepidiforma sp.]
MQRNRVLAAAAALLGAAALVPIATVLGDDGPGGSRVEFATALTTSFTYQGRLTDGGSPANGSYDLRFILYDAESGGAQVGSTVTRDDVQVTNGLFTVDLDFGASVFQGDARWMEIAVRPGSSTGAFTVLSPRQPVSPAPYALFAASAGSLKVPLAVSGNTAGAPSTPSGLITVNQAGTGIAIAANRTTTDPAEYPAVLGVNAGGGAGVQGEATAANGVGVRGFATQGTAGAFVGPVALELDGALKVSNDIAFVHNVVTSGTSKNTCAGSDAITVLTHPLLDDNPDALVFVTPQFMGSLPTDPVAVRVDYRLDSTAPCTGVAGRWTIRSMNGADFPPGATFNVLVITK